ncbi:ATP-dependent nuclease [Pseudomonas sp. MAC6]|uniref:ATP-dependent nuclease n=1 Tax=Pseudomonas sp. MAC6 TaxID=3401633 RepID=UPI003BF541C6
MQITFEIRDVQHVESLTLSLNLSEHKISCIVGKNGVGKTTLIKAIKNFSLADTFKKTSADSIFHKNSNITYKVNEEIYSFEYIENISSLNCKKNIPDEIKENIDVELPLPHGQRFNFFQTISNVDDDIRRAVVLEQYSKPDDLISFLSEIYDSDKFNNIRAIKVKSSEYYCIVLPENKYIREDYLSSGEYLLISLYRKIKSRRKLIVIDEIDISLDAAAQVRLIRWLRACCTEFQINVLFTSHSLAMIRMLDDGELYYMQVNDATTEIKEVSYNYIKSVMFGFNGYDKYILTEDITLRDFLQHIIAKYCPNTFYKYHIIHTGTATSVADLLQRNITEEFLSIEKNVIAVMDGDMRNEEIGSRLNTYCIPIDSVEKALHDLHENGGVHPRITGHIPRKEHKRVFKDLLIRNLMSKSEIFELLCNTYSEDIEAFAVNLRNFLYPVRL